MELMKPIHDYNEKLAKAGKLVWADVLLPSSQGARLIAEADGSLKTIKGPFEHTTGGYAILTAKDLDEAIALVKAGPTNPQHAGRGLEIRQIVDLESLPVPEEVKAKGREMRELMKKNAQALSK